MEAAKEGLGDICGKSRCWLLLLFLVIGINKRRDVPSHVFLLIGKSQKVELGLIRPEDYAHGVDAV